MTVSGLLPFSGYAIKYQVVFVFFVYVVCGTSYLFLSFSAKGNPARKSSINLPFHHSYKVSEPSFQMKQIVSFHARVTKIRTWLNQIFNKISSISLCTCMNDSIINMNKTRKVEEGTYLNKTWLLFAHAKKQLLVSSSWEVCLLWFFSKRKSHSPLVSP
jgi:hypothetical protein